MTNILLLCSFLFYSMLHPLHLSVTEIEHDANRNALEMTMRIFLDDLEASVRNDLQKPDMDITAPGPEHTTDDLLEDYLRKHFNISADGKNLPYEYLGHEVELPVIYLYVQSSNVKKVNDISIFNDMIMETYDDQANLVHVKVGDKVKSLKLTVNKKRGSLNFQ